MRGTGKNLHSFRVYHYIRQYFTVKLEVFMQCLLVTNNPKFSNKDIFKRIVLSFYNVIHEAKGISVCIIGIVWQ